MTVYVCCGIPLSAAGAEEDEIRDFEHHIVRGAFTDEKIAALYCWRNGLVLSELDLDDPVKVMSARNFGVRKSKEGA